MDFQDIRCRVYEKVGESKPMSGGVCDIDIGWSWQSCVGGGGVF